MKSEIINLLNINKIPHALFFLGPEGCGNLITAINFAKKILCKKNYNSCLLKFNKFQHPDLHFIFPLPLHLNQINYLNKWRFFLKRQHYGNLSDWIKLIKSNYKQCFIYKKQIDNLIKIINYKSYESYYKIIIFWMPEQLTLHSSNKLLKILEDPPKKTIFLLVGENDNLLLPTLKSRVNIIRFNKYSFNYIKKYLEYKFNTDIFQSKLIAYKSEGNLNKALKLSNNIQEKYLEYNFVSWIRNLFLLKKYPIFLYKIIFLSIQINFWSKEKQKKFFIFLLEIFRKAFIYNYNVIKDIPITYNRFKWYNFCLYINIKNIEKISMEINKAIFDIENNAIVKIVFLDFSLKINEILLKKK
ncbi:DNA polymerase III subunit [Candidatus Karelsulcia muelleri]|uniref:DNA polymerase III subunit delta n=1 Tax=Candidatus Karelsulcia muelleri TaxID=336810 RepID=A0A3A1MMQ8_9FLAO|nr:DNA polymerase III subunit delta' [Candidatus Karelsulcia muelleri]RIU86560.1 DNA polymerase III subunit delta' [Candidatus Karelsulcia muelleri]